MNRQRRVIDLMLTAYSVLRDRYARRALLLNLAIFFSACILLAATFFPEDALVEIGIGSRTTKMLTGLFSALVLFASVAELRLRWRELSQSYGEAAERLAGLKSHARTVSAREGGPSEVDTAEVARRFETTMQGLRRVPDRLFVRLKAYHLRKVRLSQMCDKAVGCPVWILRCRLLIEGLRGTPEGDGCRTKSG